MDKIIAYCGLDCSKCDAYIATKNNDEKLRIKTAELWSKLNGITILPEHINCEGCRCDGKKTVFCDKLCKIKQCAEDKKYQTCGDCNNIDNCNIIKMITDTNKDALNRLKGEKHD